MLQKLTSAAFTGTLIALAVDVLLQTGLGILHGYLRRMVLIGTTFDGLRWTVAVVLFSAVAPAIDRRLAAAGSNSLKLSTRGAWIVTGVVWVALPVAWEVASLLIMALRVAMAGTWQSGFSLFLEPAFYSDLIIAYAPWLLAGVTLLSWAGHRDAGR